MSLIHPSSYVILICLKQTAIHVKWLYKNEFNTVVTVIKGRGKDGTPLRILKKV